MRYISYIIIGVLILVYFTKLNNYSTSIEPLNYVLRSLYHANTSHLVANCISFYALSFIEEVIGKAQFAFAILFIWIVSSILLYTYHTIVPSKKVYTVGFSAVIFGLIVVYYSMINKSAGITFAGLAISIIPQLFMSGISVSGHICGIIAGIIYISVFGVKKINI